MYWLSNSNLFHISSDPEIKPISPFIVKPGITPPMLPPGFEIKTLQINHYEEIFKLINNSYTEDEDSSTRITFSREYILSYLKTVPPNFSIGLALNGKLVGLITATICDLIIYQKKIKVPSIAFFCLQSKIRGAGLGLFLIEEMKIRLAKINMNYAIFSSNIHKDSSFLEVEEFSIPINHSKLLDVGFIDEIPCTCPKREFQIQVLCLSNQFHLLKEEDIPALVPKLNKSLESYTIKTFFTDATAKHSLIPKKNVVYSFVKKNKTGVITDFLSLNKTYLYHRDLDQVISVGNLTYYFHETLDLTTLISIIIEKLPSYDIDQLTFRNTAESSAINLMKFQTKNKYSHYLCNVSIKHVEPEKTCFHLY